MTQKIEKSPVATKAVTEAETETTPVKSETKTDAGIQQNEQTELVTELRDTVKRIDPRKHTEKTLRRVLFNISDILKDIETLYTKS